MPKVGSLVVELRGLKRRLEVEGGCGVVGTNWGQKSRVHNTRWPDGGVAECCHRTVPLVSLPDKYIENHHQHNTAQPRQRNTPQFLLNQDKHSYKYQIFFTNPLLEFTLILSMKGIISQKIRGNQYNESIKRISFEWFFDPVIVLRNGLTFDTKHQQLIAIIWHQLKGT